MTSILRTVALSVFLSTTFVMIPYSALAVDTGSTQGGTSNESAPSGLTNPLNNINSLPDFINAILDAVVQLGTILLTFAIVYVGFKFVAAQGNEEEIRSARTALMWTVIGGLVLLGAKTIGLVISATVKGL